MDKKIVEINQFEKDVISVLKKIKNVDSLRKTIQKLIENLGFSNFDLTQFGSNNDRNAPNVIFHTLPDSMIETYLAEGLHKNELSNDYYSESSHSIYHSTIHAYFLGSPCPIDKLSKSRRIDRLLKEYTFFDAYSYPIIDDNRNGKIVLTLFSRGTSENKFKELVRTKNGKISCIAKSIAAIFPGLDLELRLTRRGSTPEVQRVYLDILDGYSRLGMTKKQVAQYTRLTEGTVTKYEQKIKRLFGKPTMAGSYCEAVRQGLLKLER